MTAEIHKMPEPKARLHCTTCHEEGFAPCNCEGATFITLAEAKTRRKEFATDLYKQGLTMAQIAERLHVSETTIRNDLADFNSAESAESKRVKTATNPKGAGRKKGTTARPKGSVRAKRMPKLDEAVRILRPLFDAGTPFNEKRMLKEHGISHGTLAAAVAYLKGHREATSDPIIDPSTLSLSAQEKLAAALRQQKLIHEREYQQRLEDAVVKWTEETGIKHFAEQYDKAKYLIERRGGVITSRQYALVLSCLHPDSRHALSDEKMAEAFRIFAPLKLKLCDNKEVPVNFPPMPTTRAEWEARREAVRQQRKAARSSKASTNCPVSQA